MPLRGRPPHQRSWRHAEVLLVGAILAPGRRTVASILRIAGLSRERRFVNYHRVLNRAAWSGRAAAKVLLGLLLDAFVPAGPVLLGLDDTIERRRGACIAAKGIYRDPVRSSHGHFVKASGLRWLSLMLLAPIPWAGRVWALPFLTALAPSERYRRERGLRHKKLTDWGRQLVLQARCWMPGRRLILVTDSGFSALEFLAALLRQEITCVTRLRLDAALYRPAPPRQPGTIGRPRTKGERLPTLAAVLTNETTRWQRLTVPGWYGEGDRVVEICSDTAVWYHAGLPVVPIRWVLLRDPGRRFDPQALLCTDLAQEPLQIVRWFVQRWQLEVTFREVRDHLGVETQRQWSDKAIARTTPCLLGLFSIVTLLASCLNSRAQLRVSASAWYHKQRPTFADSLAAVRREIWSEQGFALSRHTLDATKLPPALREGIAYALCHAA
ncbi:IS701 family transposase [Belnapia moabensis]|uniref:IS701 family transposase n=1 Tax=Belnapia moabensis TaxID=365533 RepID=UPI0005BAC3F2|nr:transposase [Belnapia moabensis]